MKAPNSTARCRAEHARVKQLIEHALDAVRMLADILEEQDAVVEIAGKYGVPTRCATIARLPPHSVPVAPMRRTVERALDRPFVVAPARRSSASSMNADGVIAPKSYDAIGPANVTIPPRASAASWNAVKSE